MSTFEVGKSYYATSACDHNCVFVVEIVKRTAKTADTHGGYEHCPFLELKQLAFDRKVLSSDVPDDLTSK